MGNLALHSAEEPDNLRATTGTVEVPTERDNDAALGTRVNNVYSSFDYIRSGVVQGSCLGPLLFLIYINDIIDCSDDKGNCKLYADDVKLYTAEIRCRYLLFPRLFRSYLSVVSHLAVTNI